MDIKNVELYYNKFKAGQDKFYELMQKRVHEILLIAPFYDAYIFEQDGRLSEQLHGEYMQLNLSTAPRITSVPTEKHAFSLLKQKKFDLVITMMRIGETTPFELSKKVKELYPGLPVLLLLNVAGDLAVIDKNSPEMKYIDNVFCWNGDSKIFLSMVKYLEDKWNVANDTKVGHVSVFLLVEDSIQYYSKFHPVLYSVILKQTQRLIGEELNELNKRQRMRARPKVLLCHSYEEAVETYERYRDYVSAVISDMRFSYAGKLNSRAGIKLIKYIQESGRECPTILQSSEPENARIAEDLGVYFLHKNSKNLLNNLSKFIIENLGYGDFVFRNPEGIEIERASSLEDLVKKLSLIPDESLLYHGRRNHFSSWLVAHGEFHFARRLKSRKVEDFDDAAEIRKLLQDTFFEARQIHNKGKIIKFNPAYLDMEGCVVSLAEGSLGGKGRGLSFLNYLLTFIEKSKDYQNVKVRIPKTFIIGTSVFDEFMESNDLNDWVAEKNDEEIKERFVQCELPTDIIYILRKFLERIDYPITIRSSGLLEDSQSQPFAGVYDTYMIPNNHPEIEMRLKHLTDAIKLVFSSVFLSSARNYIESINYKLEEEKMAIVIQEIVGHQSDEDQFFPLFSGVAQSYNFYPSTDMNHDDGIVSLAVGLGRAVVDGESIMRFCPKYPRIDLLKPEDMVSHNQKYFYALDLSVLKQGFISDEDSFISQIDISDEYKAKYFKQLTSVWDYQNERFLDGAYIAGPRVLTFRNLLYYNEIALAEILKDLLEIGEISFGVPVEIEFAVEYTPQNEKQAAEFNLLQIRPLSINRENINVSLDMISRKELLLLTTKAMGNGFIDYIRDIVYVDPEKFDNTQTLKMAAEIAIINEKLRLQKREYILIGAGRWGTRDRFLGIPVRWEQINMARIIVETSQKNFAVDASQGSHFFHNLMAMNAFYFTVSHSNDNDFIDWEWLQSQPAKTAGEFVIHVELPQAVQVKTDGKKGYAIISKP